MKTMPPPTTPTVDDHGDAALLALLAVLAADPGDDGKPSAAARAQAAKVPDALREMLEESGDAEEADARAYAETPPQDAPPLDTLDWALRGYQPERDPETGDWLQGDQPPDDADGDDDAGAEADHAAYAEGYTGERKDALGRRRCYRDGRPVPCAPREGEPGPADRRKQQRQEQEAARRSQPPQAKAADPPATTAKLKEILGEDVGLEHAPALVGAPPGSTVTVSHLKWRGYPVVEIAVDHPDFQFCERSFSKRDDGRIVMRNNMFFLKKKARGGGLGTEVFSAEVKALAEQGVDAIETCAGKGKGMNGFSTWPRLGYDAAIPDNLRKKLPPALANAKTVLELYKTKEGREWWGGVPQPDGTRKGANGVQLGMTFDLTPGSPSMVALNAYLTSKGKPPIEIDAAKVQALREGRDRAKKEPQRTEQEQRERAHAEVMQVHDNAAQWARRAGLDPDRVEEDATNEAVAIAHERGGSGAAADPDPAALWRTAYRRVVERHVLAR
jgi:hypothetical protein